MSAYYNEIDPGAAQWLRELMKAGVIAPGIVDERSIEDVAPAELMGFTQCHFFAGIGVWSAALRGAGWPDDRPVWTGSCPCQPFSQAGKGEGFADERHLWPAWLHLIKQGKGPEVPVFGEQVASKDGLTWLDLVRADMEGEGYEIRAVDLCAAGFGAPHIRQRIFFHARLLGHGARPQGRQRGDAHAQLAAAERAGEAHGVGIASRGGGQRTRELVAGINGGQYPDPGAVGGLGDSGHVERWGRDSIRAADGEHGRSSGQGEGAGAEGQRPEHDTAVPGTGGGMGHAHGERAGRLPGAVRGAEAGEGGRGRGDDADAPSAAGWTSPTNGFWRDADWLFCKDGKWRPVEPGTFPLAHGAPGRMGLLRGYGNAINKEVAEGFIATILEEEAEATLRE